MTGQTMTEAIRFLLDCVHDKEDAAPALYNLILSAATFLCAEEDETFEKFKRNVEQIRSAKDNEYDGDMRDNQRRTGRGRNHKPNAGEC